MCQGCVGNVSVMFRWFSGGVFDLFQKCPRDALGMCWWCFRDAMEMSEGYFKDDLAMFKGFYGDASEMCW